MAQLDLYYNTKITPKRNAFVDQIDTYLATITGSKHITITDFMHQRIGVEPIDVKIDANQSMIIPNGTNGVVNYATIKFNESASDTKVYYFFVSKYKQVSENTIRFTLTMDTVNTYQKVILTGMTDKTTIIREHEDRFDNKFIIEGNAVTLNRKVDPVSEGIAPIKLLARPSTEHGVLTSSTYATAPVQDTTGFEYKWYIQWKTDENITTSKTKTSGTEATTLNFQPFIMDIYTEMNITCSQ